MRSNFRAVKKFTELITREGADAHQQFLKNPAVRDYYLKPLGLEESRTSVMPKERTVVNFPNWNVILRRPSKQVDPNVAVFELPLEATKPEISQFMQKVYKLRSEKVNTLIQMGKIKGSSRRKFYRESDIKKAYISFNGEVPEGFRKVMRKGNE